MYVGVGAAAGMAEDRFASLLEEFSLLVSGDGLFSYGQPPAAHRGCLMPQESPGTAATLDEPRNQAPVTAEVGRVEEKKMESYMIGARDFGSSLAGHGVAVEIPLPTEHMAPDVGQSLPELADELLQAQSSQHTEVARREDVLKELKVEVQGERDHLHSLQRDVYAASKSICLAQDSAGQVGLECNNLEKEISTLVHEIQNLKEELEETRRKSEEEEKVGRESRRRINRHRARAEEVEQACPVQQELEGLRAAIECLKDRRGSYMQGEGLLILSGERQRQLQEQITATKATTLALTRENGELHKQVQAGNQHIHQLKREVDVAKKRHQAQLTRLHRQVQEAQARRRKWAEDTDHLRTAIANLRQKIEE